MIINVGSENKIKIDAVKEVIKDYPQLRRFVIIGTKAKSEVSEQPLSLEETLSGARNRAKNSFNNCSISIGLEDGLMMVPYTKTGFMNVCACVIYDGSSYYSGLSSAFEYPQEVVDLILKKYKTVSEAAYYVGLTDVDKIGTKDGAISVLTHGRLIRKEYLKQALTMALIGLDN